MAAQNFSSALRTPAPSRPYAKANPGYGKRSVPHQQPPRADDFMLLPERERYIAGYLDHLPDGSAMDIKSLARDLPPYGQMAVGSALRALGVAGHLRQVQCQVESPGKVRWVTRTYWSRTAHDNEWWSTFLDAENHRAGTEAQAPALAAEAVAEPAAEPTPAAPVAATPAVPAVPATPTAPAVAAVPQQRAPEPAPQHPSPAYLALAQLGRTEPRLALSAADCTTLEPLATQWFTRGVDATYLTHALTAGLPTHVDSPIGFLRRRLYDKMPPCLPTTPTPASTGTPARRVMAECTECGTPGPPQALPDGLCRTCRTPDPGHLPTAPAGPFTERDIHALVGSLRDLMKAP
ncbi:MarR family transcriptional regulator [Streptomyces sp. NPDC052052]|uniref:MarR family transcriptional regulator n=1 Tax=Streptomyces sp. NPDC052052 TaxID=3154756 RepID=UPI00343F1BB7